MKAAPRGGIDFSVVIPAILAGNTTARNKLMLEFYPWSVVQAMGVVRETELAKDVAVGFWEWLFTENGLSEYAPTGSFYAWMKTCIRYRAINAVRKRRVCLLYCDDVFDPKNYTAGIVGQLIAMQDIETVSRELRSAMQKAVFQRLIEGYTKPEIAADLGLSQKYVKNMIGEVRKVINSHLRA